MTLKYCRPPPHWYQSITLNLTNLAVTSGMELNGNISNGRGSFCFLGPDWINCQELSDSAISNGTRKLTQIGVFFIVNFLYSIMNQRADNTMIPTNERTVSIS